MPKYIVRVTKEDEFFDFFKDTNIYEGDNHEDAVKSLERYKKAGFKVELVINKQESD